MTAELRPYQLRALEEVREAIRAGHKRILLQLPTGAGKTLTGASMLQGALAKGNRSMFVAHRLELIDQTVTTFARLGIYSLGVVRAKDLRTDYSQPIQVCSIQTLCRRGPLNGIRIVFVDEAHRSCGKTYVKHLFEAYPDAVFIGLTATPCRADGKPLGAHWTAMVQGATYAELIEAGHLVAPDVASTPVLPDLSSVRTLAGEYNAEDLEAAVNKRALIGNALAEWQKWSAGRRTVAFAVSVAHSRAIVETFQAAGVTAEHLDGETPESERRAILMRLEAGTTQFVSNVGVLCEGWDCPPVKCLLVLRPTKSLALWMQMAGRILRPWEGVTPIILDHGGNVDRVVDGEKLGLPHEDRYWSLDGRAKRKGATPTKCCPSCFSYVLASLMVCPHCGAPFPERESPEPDAPNPSLTHVELQLREATGDAEQLTYFRQLAKEAECKRWKPGAVLHRFKLRFRTLPPRRWWNALVRAAKADPEWRARVFAEVPEAWVDT
jgi:DNA repair protein RadD